MPACSCGIAHDDNPNTCPFSLSQPMRQDFLPNSFVEEGRSPNNLNHTSEAAAEMIEPPPPASTLIEFPGTSRSVPEWRRQLSQRVREVQERKAREAAEELAAAQEAGLVSVALPSAQLELVPNLEQPVMNPIVSKALERIERARRADHSPPSFAATSSRPAMTEPEPLELSDTPAPIEAKPKLTVVATQKPLVEPEPFEPEPIETETIEQPFTEPAPIFEQQELKIEPAEPRVPPPRQRKPVRVISDSVEDPALSYLESCLSVPALESDTRRDLAGVFRRIFCGLLDLMLVALMVSPVVAAFEFSEVNWLEPRVIGWMAGIVVATMFVYLTMSIALTGRTLGMRLVSVRTIDLRTGLIPTGGQSVKRAIGYIFSLAFLGLGLIYALVDPDGRAVHDRFSNTIVIRD
jgi:uncharacterized RDD family membrane protein YckC